MFTVPAFTSYPVFVAKSEVVDWGLTVLNLPNIWKRTSGKGIKVCVLDSGYTYHTDLHESITATANFTDEKNSEAVFPHGNYIAGIIGARTNSFGVVGVAPECELLLGKVLNNNGQASSRSIIDGIEWGSSCGASIINLSFGCFIDVPEVYDCIKKASEAGLIFVAAAGNEGPGLDTINYPAKYDEVISVGAINKGKNVPNFSSRGERLDLIAPGENILTTDSNNGYVVVSGTSFACPFVSGIVALLLSLYPYKNVSEVKSRLKAACIDLDGYNNLDEGWGLINPDSLFNEN